MAEDRELHCSREEGEAYREGVYRPLEVESLPDAPRTPEYPDPGRGPSFHELEEIPRVPRLRYVLGPSIVALGMGLGAGEFLLWPNLIAVNGFSIWWLFWVGVLTQFIVIGEIERWTIATGESIFAGMRRMTHVPIWPWFFLVATLVSFAWPGWASQSASFTLNILNGLAGREVITDWQPVALAMMAFIWIALALSRIVYNALEKFEIGLVVLFFPILFVALLAAGVLPGDVAALARGAVSIGSAPRELLSGAQFPTLLIAVAYAGSGGTLLLAQSLWIRDKGFGMAAHQGRIAGIRGKNEIVHERGFAFRASQSRSLERFRAWVRLGESELWATFVALILLSVVITTLLISATIGTGNAEMAGKLTEMVRAQAEALRERGGAWLELAFLLGGTLVLFSTQVAIVDTVTRITGDIFHDLVGRRRHFTIRGTFLSFLTATVGVGMGIIALSWALGASVDALRPNLLILIAGPFTILSMYVFAIVVAVLNTKYLPSPMRTPPWKLLGMYWAVILWGWFSAETISRLLLDQILHADPAVVHGIVLHPVRVGCYLAWLGSLIWLVTQTAPRVFARR